MYSFRNTGKANLQIFFFENVRDRFKKSGQSLVVLETEIFKVI